MGDQQQLDQKRAPATAAISHTSEKHRSQERVLGLVRTALEGLGGMSRFVKAGQTVLIKPNQTLLLGGRRLHNRFADCRGFDSVAKSAGASRVQVAESSGGFFSSLECMRITGMGAVDEREGPSCSILAAMRS